MIDSSRDSHCQASWFFQPSIAAVSRRLRRILPAQAVVRRLYSRLSTTSTAAGSLWRVPEKRRKSSAFSFISSVPSWGVSDYDPRFGRHEGEDIADDRVAQLGFLEVGGDLVEGAP